MGASRAQSLWVEHPVMQHQVLTSGDIYTMDVRFGVGSQVSCILDLSFLPHQSFIMVRFTDIRTAIFYPGKMLRGVSTYGIALLLPAVR